MTDNNGSTEHEECHAPTPTVPVAPDGGWGWVVCFCSFMQSVLIDGLCFSFGLLFTEFLHFYKASKGKTSWAGSVMNGTYMVMGPFAGAMVNKFGCRKVAICGALLAACSLFVSMFSPTVEVLIFTYGFLVGTGFGFLYLPSIVIVSQYFDKKRALATGIAVCGSGIGGFVFAPLVELLIVQYRMEGTLMMLSGIILNAVVFACFYRPIAFQTADGTLKEEDGIGKANNGNTNSVSQSGGTVALKPSDSGLVQLNGTGQFVSDHRWPRDDDETGDRELVRFALSQDMAHLMTKNNCCKRTVHKHFRTRDEADKERTEENVNVEFSRLTRSQDIPQLRQLRDTPRKEHRKHINPLIRMDVFYSGSIQNLPTYKEMGHEKFVERMMTSTESIDNGNDTNGDRGEKNVCVRAWKTFTTVMDFSLLTSVTFDVYGLSCFLCMTGFFIPFTYLPDMCQEFGISSTKAAMLISIIGITNTVGRILVGLLSDRPWADCLLINNISLTLCGISVVLMPFTNNYIVLVVYCVIFGAGIAAFVSLRSIIMVDLLGIEKLTNSFGLVTLCQGLSSYIGSPIAGSLSDWTGSYHAAFYLSGVTLTTAGLICFPLRRIARWEKCRREHKLRDLPVTLEHPEAQPMMGSKS